MLSEKIHMTYASSLAVGHMNLRTAKTPRRSDFEKIARFEVFLRIARVAGNGAIRGIMLS